jgi:hypothetical protein
MVLRSRRRAGRRRCYAGAENCAGDDGVEGAGLGEQTGPSALTSLVAHPSAARGIFPSRGRRRETEDTSQVAAPTTSLLDSVTICNNVRPVGSSSPLRRISVYPVMLPPGRLRLAARPSWTGSKPTPNTIGMLAVAARAARAAGVLPGAAMTATRRRTNPLHVLASVLRRHCGGRSRSRGLRCAQSRPIPA